MKNLTLIIGGRDYVVACADGEDAHVTRLGRIIDEALASSPPGVGQSETRSLLFAALLLADEVHAARAAAGGAGEDAVVAERRGRMLATIAARIENIAAHLEGEAADA